MVNSVNIFQAGYERLQIRGASLDRGEHHYVLRLEHPYRFLSSAPLGEGHLASQWLLSLEVTPDADIPCPEDYIRERAAGFGVPSEGQLIGLLTAVRHRDLQVAVRSEAGVTVATLATAGVSNASSPRQNDASYDPSYMEAGPSGAAPWGQHIAPSPGTINLVTLVDADLSPGALVRASTIATEAKTLALIEAGVLTRNGSVATGTSTDATVAGHSGQGVHFDYAGSPTIVGWLVAATAHDAVSRGIQAYRKRKEAEGKPAIAAG